MIGLNAPQISRDLLIKVRSKSRPSGTLEPVPNKLSVPQTIRTSHLTLLVFELIIPRQPTPSLIPTPLHPKALDKNISIPNPPHRPKEITCPSGITVATTPPKQLSISPKYIPIIEDRAPSSITPPVAGRRTVPLCEHDNRDNDARYRAPALSLARTSAILQPERGPMSMMPLPELGVDRSLQDISQRKERNWTLALFLPPSCPAPMCSRHFRLARERAAATAATLRKCGLELALGFRGDRGSCDA